MAVMSWLGVRREPEASSADSPFDSFWQWFAGAEDRLRSAHDGRESDPVELQEAVAEISDRLRRVHPELCFEFGRADDGIYELILSAGGIRSLFPAISALMQAAPEVPGWRVIAFRPRKDSDFRVCLGGLTLEADALWYRLSPAEDHADLELYISGLTADTLEVLGSAAFLMLDTALGEYDVATRIGAIDFDALPDDPAAEGLKPITELRAEFDAVFPQTAQ